MTYTLLEDKPLPTQPSTKDGPYELQRPTREDIAYVSDPYNESLTSRYLVLNRYRLRVPEDADRPSGRTVPHPDGLWGHYEIHGEQRPSLFKTWHRARAQALGGTAGRPGVILMFNLHAMPVVTSEDEVRTVLRRPQANRIWEEEDEHQFAERMAGEWMIYAERTKR